MLTRRVIPCLDVRDGRVVKGVQFANLRDAGDPAELAHAYARQGADELVILDVTATLEGRLAMLATIRAVRRVLDVPLTVGGGIRSVDDARAALQAGADKVSVNTAAVEDPGLIARLSGEFGRQCTVLAIDAASAGEGAWVVVTHAGRRRRDLSVTAWARQAEALGIGEVLLTSFDRDGARSGYDLPLLSAVSSAVGVPVIASGGADSAAHMAQAFAAGADAALAASIFHDADTTVDAVKRELLALGVPVRPPQEFIA